MSIAFFKNIELFNNISSVFLTNYQNITTFYINQAPEIYAAFQIVFFARGSISVVSISRSWKYSIWLASMNNKWELIGPIL